MEIKKIDNKETWNNWLKKISQPSFTQSFEWGDILLQEGKEVERLVLVDNGEIVAAVLIEYHNLPFGWRYAFCPKGPVVSEKLKTEILKVFQSAGSYLKDKKCLFFRFELDNDFKFTVSDLLLKKAPDINPRATVILNLKQSDEELLAKMHSKTRYNINLAERKNLRVSEEKNFLVFIKLMSDTAKRDDFRLHQMEHYKKVLASPLTKQITIYNDEQAIAVGVFVGFGNTFTYLYGASDYDSRQLMAPYLIQWQGIKIGRESGYDFYDFFGIAPTKEADGEFKYDKKHQYAGVTRFKLGFGGLPKESAGTIDMILLPTKYKIYKLMRKIRRIF
ncbi:MAG: hypothetical protein COU29_02745 [Candidatus Magasanikbacteria bacterium CG10_big_fil_rev_8_21_14_0_10_36_32]|uniref:BioF2-like acetyltransferase domain-containing protein n=1 Tax=Candidatus Magasanikbacteria bacterium CG10_big_fil_rev_8_21_14_0_10_36_32 TaxID=1974646 RepID=A0A2M6W779_9BACT|nr:MAG: hypothetical protein COU29_02745 [Candidatus Magasanikbacteria bacterium CG10_big_fil_rev_8_21_14_0_10_36_32]